MKFLTAVAMLSALLCRGGFDEEEWIVLSNGLSPEVRLAATESSKGLIFGIEAAGKPYAAKGRLAVCSDGRTKIYESIVKGQNSLEAGTPESFNVLIKEMQSLCLDVRTEKKA